MTDQDGAKESIRLALRYLKGEGRRDKFSIEEEEEDRRRKRRG